MNETLETLVAKAQSGDKAALEQVVLGVKDMVYNLSAKMLLFPEDAQDASQEILVRLVTRLSTYKGDSKFTTWAYRVAVNYLLTAQGKQSRKFAMDFDQYANFVDAGQSPHATTASNEGELRLLELEVKTSCTQGLLLCLAPSSRLVYIVGDILGLDGPAGAQIIGTTPANFRQQLARGRAKVRNFLQAKCGLANPKNPCRCHKKVDFLVDKGLVSKPKLKFAQHVTGVQTLHEQIAGLESELELIRTNPNLPTPASIIEKMKELIEKI